MPIAKGRTACYECKPKPSQKVYPICTIRSTPDKPVHCIVWAKELFKLLLGNAKDSMLFEDTAATGDSSTYMDLVNSWHARLNIDSNQGFIATAKSIFISQFNTEINKKIEMDVYKTALSLPSAIDVKVFDESFEAVLQQLSSGSPRTNSSGWDTSTWTVEQCITELGLAMFDALSLSGGSLIGKMSFDKDDELAMKFVCAASNLRSKIFK
jgi:ubiquitin-like 1-activating enzyme E1 B